MAYFQLLLLLLQKEVDDEARELIQWLRCLALYVANQVQFPHTSYSSLTTARSDLLAQSQAKHWAMSIWPKPHPPKKEVNESNRREVSDILCYKFNLFTM